MKKKALDIFIRVLCFLGSALLTIFAGMFALVALAAFVMSVADNDFVSAVGGFACVVIAWVLWSVRKDTLA